MNYAFTTYSIIYVIATLMAVVGALLGWYRRSVKGAMELSFLMMACAVASLALVFETSAATLETKLFWSKIEYIGAVASPVLYLLFVLRYGDYGHILSRVKILLLFLVPVVTLVMVFTNELHLLHWSGFSAIDPKTNLMEYHHGPWFWVGYTGYTYLIMILATLLLVRMIIKRHRTFRTQSWIILLGGMTPWVASFIYLTGLNPVPGLDLVPIGILLSSLILIHAILGNQLLDLVPVARATLVETMEDGILVLDPKDRLIDINSAAMNALGITLANPIGQQLIEMELPCPELIESILNPLPVTQLQCELNDPPRSVRVTRQPLTKHPGYRLVVLTDITTEVAKVNEILRRDKLMDAISRAISILVQGDELEPSIYGALDVIGRATNVNRVYIFQNHRDPAYSMPLMSQRFEWTDGTVSAQIDNKYLQNLPYEQVCPRWFEILSRGELVVGNIRDFPEQERIDLSAQDIKSILVAPVFIDKSFWGFIGFDDCKAERQWSHTKEQILAAAANTIGAAYMRSINQSELLAAKEKAEQSDRLKSAFLANMSHEIRTPLNGILGFTSLLTEEDDLPVETRNHYATIINRSAENLIRIIDDILDISKLETGLVTMVISTFRINEVLLDLHTLYMHKMREKKKGQISLDLLNPPNQVMVHADRSRLSQVFINLLDNALKFTHEGSITFGVTDVNEHRIEFMVKDTGIGISPGRQSLIFERFAQASEEISHTYGGAGLGLSIVRKLIELMNGEITVESEPGKGSTFRFFIPQ